jgi:hypothetical protein
MGYALALGHSFATDLQIECFKKEGIVGYTLGYSHIIAVALYTYCSSY